MKIVRSYPETSLPYIRSAIKGEWDTHPIGPPYNIKDSSSSKNERGKQEGRANRRDLLRCGEQLIINQ